MKWEDTKPDIQSLNVGVLTQHLSVIDTLALLLRAQELPFVICSKSTHENMIHHLSTKHVELGGLLTGYIYSTDDLHQGMVAIHVTESVASEDYYSTGVSLSMDSDVWQKANSSASDGTFVVGWYHSHPNLGAFFSGTDRHTQKSFFNNNYSLGLVIDPIRNESKWFLGPNCIELPANRILYDEIVIPRLR